MSVISATPHGGETSTRYPLVGYRTSAGILPTVLEKLMISAVTVNKNTDRHWHSVDPNPQPGSHAGVPTPLSALQASNQSFWLAFVPTFQPLPSLTLPTVRAHRQSGLRSICSLRLGQDVAPDAKHWQTSDRPR